MMGNIKADVFDSPNCRCNLTMGRDIPSKIGVNTDFDTQTTKWMGHETAMAQTSIATDLLEQISASSSAKKKRSKTFESFAEQHSDAMIMDRKCQAASPEEDQIT